MLSNTELLKLQRFISAQRRRETSPLERLWAVRCEALLTELHALERQVDDLTREVDTVMGSKASDTCVI